MSVSAGDEPAEAGSTASWAFVNAGAGPIHRAGRYVAFSSDASNLVEGDTNGAVDIFVRDLDAGTTVRVSVALDGSQALLPPLSCGGGFTEGSFNPQLTPDGRFVAFISNVSNLVTGDTNAFCITWGRRGGFCRMCSFTIATPTGSGPSTTRPATSARFAPI